MEAINPDDGNLMEHVSAAEGDTNLPITSPIHEDGNTIPAGLPTPRRSERIRRPRVMFDA